VSLALVVFVLGCSILLSELILIQDRDGVSSYECGFEQGVAARIVFSFRYFYLTLVFLLFDLEIIFMLIIGFYIFSISFFFCFILFVIFVVVLYLGLFFEWEIGTLD